MDELVFRCVCFKGWVNKGELTIFIIVAKLVGL